MKRKKLFTLFGAVLMTFLFSSSTFAATEIYNVTSDSWDFYDTVTGQNYACDDIIMFDAHITAFSNYSGEGSDALNFNHVDTEQVYTSGIDPSDDVYRNVSYVVDSYNEITYRYEDTWCTYFSELEGIAIRKDVGYKEGLEPNFTMEFAPMNICPNATSCSQSYNAILVNAE